ncbi:MAG: GTPase Era [Deltaproteobacteria bacterium]
MGFKSGFVTIIGRPNVGKSTLLNKLAGEKIAIMSDKPQTTRNSIKAIVTDKDYQIVFIDTPGIHKPKHKLGEYMVKSATGSIGDVDAVIFVVDASDKDTGGGDQFILEKLKNVKIPVLLVLNKIDTVKKEELFGVISRMKDLYKFSSVIPVSAMQGDGTGIILDELKKIIPDGPKFFPEDMITDQPERIIVAEIIREKALHLLQEEVPHGIAVEVISMKERGDKDIVDIQANIYCEKESHKPIVIGSKGSMLKEIGKRARFDIEVFLASKVFLELWVKVKKDWKDNENMLKTLFGDY